MQYNQPYGVSDPNAGYINGNPSTGTMGSIPPAASIEYPQREIVNLISDAGIVPDNADLHQLAKGVQSGQLIYGDDTGAANQVSLAVNPPVTVLKKGMQFITIFAHDNTGPSSASVSGLPFIEIVHPIDRTPLNPLELRAGAIGCLAFDGTKFQLAWSNVVGSTVGAPGVPIYLTVNLDYYIGGPGASDNNDGTTIAVTTAPHGPFATLQKAMNTIANFNLNGHNITLHVADGSYAGVMLGRMAGSGQTIWLGNPTTPGNCHITGQSMSAIFAQGAGPTHSFEGFFLESNYTSGPYDCSGASVAGTGTQLALRNILWGQCSGSHLSVSQAGVVSLGAKQIINGSPLGNNPQMTSGWHIFCVNGAIIQPQGGNLPTLQILNPVGGQNGGGFAVVNTLAFFEAYYSSITGAGNFSGFKYSVGANAILNTHGSGVNYLPGNVAGTQATGGQYF
jgi:hypothetical protein